MLDMFKRAFWVPYANGDIYPTVSIAQQAISKYCEQNGWSCSFNGDDEAIIADVQAKFGITIAPEVNIW